MSQAPFILALIGSILILINAIVIAALGAVIAIMPMVGGLGIGIAAVALIFGIVTLIGAVFMNNPKKRKTGTIIVLVFSILSLFIGGGFLIGSILGIIGAALGLAKK